MADLSIARRIADSPVRIDYLGEHTELIPTLTGWFENEWPTYYGPDGPGNAQEDLDSYVNRDQLPVGVVVFLDEQPCGMAALKAESIQTYRKLGPWVAAGFVLATHRGKGLGSMLLAEMETVARRLGYKHVYCGTSTSASLLVRSGWRLRGLSEHNAERVRIFEKDV